MNTRLCLLLQAVGRLRTHRTVAICTRAAGSTAKSLNREQFMEIVEAAPHYSRSGVRQIEGVAKLMKRSSKRRGIVSPVEASAK